MINSGSLSKSILKYTWSIKYFLSIFKLLEKATNIDCHDDKKIVMESGKNTDEAKPGKRNPLAFLGLKRVDVEEEDVEDDDIDVDGEGIEENVISS